MAVTPIFAAFAVSLFTDFACSALFPIFGFFAVFTTFLSKLLSVFQQPLLWQVLPVVVFFIPCFYLLCIFECCHSPCLKVHFSFASSGWTVIPVPMFRVAEISASFVLRYPMFSFLKYWVLSLVFLCASPALLLLIAHFTVSVYSRTFFTLLVITKK